MKFATLQNTVYPSTSWTIPGKYTPSGGWQGYLFAAFSTNYSAAIIAASGSHTAGIYPTNFSIAATISLRNAAGVAILTYTVNVSGNANYQVFSGGGVTPYSTTITSYSSSVSPTTASRPNLNTDSLTSDNAYETVTPSLDIAGTTRFQVTVLSPALLAVVPPGATVTLDSFSVTNSPTQVVYTGGRTALRPYANFTTNASLFDSTPSLPCDNWDAVTGTGAHAVGTNIAHAVTDPDASLVAWSWSFGDGGTSTLAQPRHYLNTRASSVTVTLTVTDNYGGQDTITGTLFPAFDTTTGVLLEPNGTLVTARNNNDNTEITAFPGGAASRIRYPALTPINTYGLLTLRQNPKGLWQQPGSLTLYLVVETDPSHNPPSWNLETYTSGDNGKTWTKYTGANAVPWDATAYAQEHIVGTSDGGAASVAIALNTAPMQVYFRRSPDGLQWPTTAPYGPVEIFDLGGEPGPVILRQRTLQGSAVLVASNGFSATWYSYDLGRTWNQNMGVNAALWDPTAYYRVRIIDTLDGGAASLAISLTDGNAYLRRSPDGLNWPTATPYGPVLVPGGGAVIGLLQRHLEGGLALVATDGYTTILSSFDLGRSWVSV